MYSSACSNDLVPFSEYNDCTQNAVLKPKIYTDRPRVCMKLRVANVDNLDDEIQTDKQVYLSAFWSYYSYYLNYTDIIVTFIYFAEVTHLNRIWFLQNVNTDLPISTVMPTEDVPKPETTVEPLNPDDVLESKCGASDDLVPSLHRVSSIN